MDFNGQDHDMDVKFATDSIGVQLWMRGFRRHGPVSFLTGYVSTNGHKTWHQSEGIVPCWIYCAFVQTRRWPYWTWNRPIGTWKDCRPRPPSYPEIKQYILNKYKIKVPSWCASLFWWVHGWRRKPRGLPLQAILFISVSIFVIKVSCRPSWAAACFL